MRIAKPAHIRLTARRYREPGALTAASSIDLRLPVAVEHGPVGLRPLDKLLYISAGYPVETL